MEDGFLTPVLSPESLSVSQQAACLHQNHTITALKHSGCFKHRLKWQPNCSQVTLLVICVLMCDILCRNPTLPDPRKRQLIGCSAPDVIEPAALALLLRHRKEPSSGHF